MRAGLAGAGLAWQRLGRWSTAAWTALAVALVLGIGVLERRQVAAFATDRVLTGLTFGLVLPLYAYFIVERVTDRRRLEDAVLQIARHGADRRWATIGMLGTATGITAALGALLAGATVLGARGLGDSQLIADLAVSTWIGLLAGAAYLGLLGLGTSVGRAGGGRLGLLVADWLLGAGTSAFAVPWPRGHLRNLLGGEPVLSLSQPAGMALLAGLLAVYLILAVWRVPR